MTTDQAGIAGVVTWELRSSTGELRASGETRNLVTDVGDQLYASRGVGLATSSTPTGMQIGVGATPTVPVAKNGAGSFITTYLIGQAFDAGFPTVVLTAGSGATVTYKVTYGPGVGTTASPITEATVVSSSSVTAIDTSGASTIARVLLTGIASKGASDVLTVTWTHTLKGS